VSDDLVITKLLATALMLAIVWKLGLQQRNLLVQSRTHRIGYNSRARELTEAGRETWLSDGSGSTQTQALRDLGRAL
jgi:hypothetical protein